ncbi:MAG: pyrroline-5-carboxylate reductase [Leptolyngbya sp. RL_3_1]|nr:pyrroline-5-carboxylate reductase [Leptolyngbya sp. RL_3_1]
MPKTLGVIGGGVMGEALIARLLSYGIYAAGEISVGEPSEARRQFLAATYGVVTTDRNAEVIDGADVLVMAVKPQIFSVVGQDLQNYASKPPLLISIMAGVTLAQLEAAAPKWPVVRAMPNTPATVGAGMTAIALGNHTEAQHCQWAEAIFGAVGAVVTVPEHLMDAVTGLSGSGPGYIAVVIEALADGGVAAGLPRATALQLAIQTVKGTAELLQTEGMHPGVLKDRVTSPGGTTITGIAELEAAGVRSAFIEAVRAASERSRQLGS